jgi:hypothetical protein
LSDLIKLNFRDRFSKKKYSDNLFHEICPGEPELIHASGQTDGQKGMTQLIVPHRIFANAPKIDFEARLRKSVRQLGLDL